MRKSSLFTLLFCLATITQQAYAQLEIGISGGYNKNYLHTSTGYRSFTKYESLGGFEIGIPVRSRVNDWLALQIEPGFIQKNYKLIRSDFYDGVYHKTTNNYVQLPLMASFSFGGKQLRGFLNLGGYGAYWLSSYVKGMVPNVHDIPFDNANPDPADIFYFSKAYHYNEKLEFDNRRDRRIELGLLAGVGLEYLWLQKYRFFVEGRYYYALSDQQKNYMINQIPRYNDTYAIQVGCLFNIKYH